MSSCITKSYTQICSWSTSHNNNSKKMSLSSRMNKSHVTWTNFTNLMLRKGRRKRVPTIQFHWYKTKKEATLIYVNKSLESGYLAGGAKMNGRGKRKASAVLVKPLLDVGAEYTWYIPFVKIHWAVYLWLCTSLYYISIDLKSLFLKRTLFVLLLHLERLPNSEIISQSPIFFSLCFILSIYVEMFWSMVWVLIKSSANLNLIHTLFQII